MNKVLIICGPTATGKTALAIQLAQKLNGEIISADSRQAFRGMSIGTGKDVCNFKFQISNFKFQNRKLIYYEKDKVRLWGYDVVSPNEEWSPANFANMANILISDIWKRNKLPIIVGGDGFYLKALTSPWQTLYIPPNKDLRKRLEIETINQLQNRLKKIDPKRFNRMNNSDQNNPRRLIRAIEVATCQLPINDLRLTNNELRDILQIGLIVPISLIDQKIERRVQARLKAGVEGEVRKLVEKYGWNQTLKSTIAYKEWQDFFAGKITKEKVIKNWIIHEKQYARKQLVWFKKQKKIHWFDISQKNWKTSVMASINK